MSRVPLLVFACALALCHLPAPAAAQAPPGCSVSKQFTADQIEKNHWLLKGAVEIDCDTYKIYADEVEVFGDQHRVSARGDVVYAEGTVRIAGDRAEFDTEQKIGTFYAASGSASLGERTSRDMFGGQEPDMYFFGEEISKIGPDRYRVTNGRFTTCLQPTPRWELTTGSVVLRLDHYATMRNAVLRVKSVPVLYVPILYYPIKREARATGFLMPTYGMSTIRGFTISGAFFWAINRSQDATLLLDWFSKTGLGYGAEYRYAAGPGSGGEIRVYRLSERAASYTTTSGSDLLVTNQPARQSYQIQGSASQSLPFRLALRGNVNYFSDVTVQQTYQQDIYASSLRQRTYGLNLSGNWNRYSLSGTFQQNETFFSATDSYVTGDRPRISLRRSAQRLGALPIVFGVGGEVVQLVRGSTSTTQPFVNQGLTRIDVTPQVRLPVTRWTFLPMDASLTFRDTWYSQSLENGVRVSEPVNRHYFRLNASLTGPILTRVWNTPGNGYAEKFKHVIEPSVSFERFSTVSNDVKIVKFEGLDYIVGGTTSATYGITTRLLAKRRQGPAGSTAQEFLSASVFQTYYTDSRASQYDSSYSTSFTSRPPSNWSPVSINIRLTPGSSFSTQFRMEYDTVRSQVQNVSAFGGYSVGEWLRVNGGWSKQNYAIGSTIVSSDYVNGGATLRTPSNRTGGSYSFNYDLARAAMLQNRFMGYYNAQCCGFAVEVQTYNFPTTGASFPVRRDVRFNFSVTLAGLGTFSNMFGAMGGATR
jgi:LPS-assembly protein